MTGNWRRKTRVKGHFTPLSIPSWRRVGLADFLGEAEGTED